MKGVKPTQARRLRELETKDLEATDLETKDLEAKHAEPPREPRTHCFFRDPDQTDADIRAEIEAAKRSGQVRPGDRCVVFSWRDDPSAS